MNDFMEMHWGYSVWEEAASQLLKEVDRELIDDIDRVLHSSGMLGIPVASCLSLEGDVLSQWRAYADDGKGYSIGFRADQLTQLAVRPLRVLYDFEKQIEEVKTFIRAIEKVEKDEEEKRSSDFRISCLQLAFDLAALKNPAFREEQEVRLLHVLSLEESNASLKLTDPGGNAFGSTVAGEKIGFVMRDSVPTAYVDLDFSNKGAENPICQVILGPKNNALTTAVSVYLETVGIGSVEVKKSLASYR